MRDARIAMIYEGANGIQALDLVGRKLGRDGGRALTAFLNEVATFAEDNAGDEAMKAFIAPLDAAVEDLRRATMWLMHNGLSDPNNAGAGATDFTRLFGLVALGYMWARMARVVLNKQSEGATQSRLDAKLATGRFFMERMLPETSLRLSRIETGAAATMALPAEAF